MNNHQTCLNQLQNPISQSYNALSNNIGLFVKNLMSQNESRKIIRQLEDNRWAKGKWTQHEQKEYIIFIKKHSEEMQSKLTRKSKKIFLQMSKVIKTRSAQQCRSHHQKMLIYQNSLQKIISTYAYLCRAKEDKEIKTCLPISDVQKDLQKGMKVVGSMIYIVLHQNDIASY